MSAIREPLLLEKAERLFALEQLHEIGVLDRDAVPGAVTTAAEIVEAREAPPQSDRLLNGLILTSVSLVEAAWFAGLIYLGVRFLLP
jgi:hypothetical protein